ncbi:hypothetical protein ACN23B_05925 [Anabaena sp. FACHB-709]|uniref:Uncharacterized protein n=2 Tax=Nostocaceae TaxID=1162 RepID=A0A1Z4KT61_ANAVA|nr:MULTISPECIES: hypothetical protein [Nostocaceae]BAY72159.1 hypothetical protein NIES23_49830 [Trichormus variabilis NIES-23]MBD2171405.1 hypothetical protein [Anabaena cylindrica FACHB-318]MBD2263188.1 hypothetical protein [Anabaena sp. FACHB-709]MBD2272733.1 hypothetical protein [Nostoc sp. PCC 7120 = FACHB-418]MBD2283786.1 hypothetical protein [Anabaena cylindrica FACHB-170]
MLNHLNGEIAATKLLSLLTNLRNVGYNRIGSATETPWRISHWPFGKMHKWGR